MNGWHISSDMTKYWTDVYVTLVEGYVRMHMVVVRDHLAWALTLGDIGDQPGIGGPVMQFLAGCDAEYLARKMEQPQLDTDWDRIEKEVGTMDADRVLKHYGDAESVPQKETGRFVCARAAAAAVIADAKLRTL